MTAIETGMKITAVVPWFGGKRTLAPTIVRELGPHTQYFEPFCGSMAVLLAKPQSQKETVNDLHGALVNLTRVIQRPDDAERLYNRLQRVVVCEGLLRDAGVYLEADVADDERDPVEWAYWYFLASWSQRNGVAGTDRAGYQIAVRWTKTGGSPTVRFRNAVASLPAWHQRLLNVVVLNRDAFRIIDRFEDGGDTAIYVDPPYFSESRTGFTNTAGEHSRYLHEFQHHDVDDDLFSAPEKNAVSDHERLRDVLATYRKSRIVVSYYDCPRVRALYAGWTIVERTMNKALNVARGKSAGIEEAPELLIINGPSYTEGQTA